MWNVCLVAEKYEKQKKIKMSSAAVMISASQVNTYFDCVFLCPG